jgi:hypothetical protein
MCLFLGRGDVLLHVHGEKKGMALLDLGGSAAEHTFVP